MSVFDGEVARPTLRVRGLLGQAEPILTTGGRAVQDYREAFVGIDVAKLKNAVAVADGGRNGEIRYFGEVESSDASMRRAIQRIASRFDHVHFCYEAGPTGYGLYRLIRSLGYVRAAHDDLGGVKAGLGIDGVEAVCARTDID
jgi:transposase